MLRMKQIVSMLLVLSILLGVFPSFSFTAYAADGVELFQSASAETDALDVSYDAKSKQTSVNTLPDRTVYLILAGYLNEKMVFSQLEKDLAFLPVSIAVPQDAVFDSLKVFCLDADYAPVCQSKQVYRKFTDSSDYEELPLRADKSYDELVEINGGTEPVIELNDNNQISLYIGKISDNKVDDVYDVIAELNNVRELLNIDDARLEFIPCYEDGKIDDNSYRVQQVYNGVQVWCAQIVVTIDEEGYISGFCSYYEDSVKHSRIDTSNQITAAQATEIANQDASEKYETVSWSSDPCLLIIPETQYLIWHLLLCCDGSQYSYHIDAHDGTIISVVEEPELTDSVFLDKAKIEDATCNLYGVTIPITKVVGMNGSQGDIDPNTYILYNRSYYNQNLKGGNPRNLGVAVYNSVNWLGLRVDNDASGFPYKLISSESNSWDPDENIVHLQGLFALYNFNRVMETYSKYGFVVDMPLEINVNIDVNNAAYAFGNNSGSAICFKFGRTEERNRIRQLDTVGHEYTHMVQDYYIAGTASGKWFKDGVLGISHSGFEVTNSSNLEWVESLAILEGTADIMGILVEAICEGISTKDNMFFQYGETENNVNPVRNHTASNTIGNQTVQEMIASYKGTQLAYGYGPGHLDGYIVVGILRHLTENTDLSLSQLFKLWHTTITLLNAKSEFDSLRYSLVLAATKLGFEQYIDDINAACASVGIMDKTHGNDFNAWFLKGVEKAYRNGVISTQQAEGDLQVTISRRDYIQLLANLCGANDIDIGADAIVWAKSIGIIGDTWNGSYLDENIPRWQAALLFYQAINYYVEKSGTFGNQGWKNIYTYAFVDEKGTDHYDRFKKLGFVDWGLYITTPDFTEMSQYYRNCDTVTKFQMQYMNSKSTSKSYETNTLDTDTSCALYYMGFYQLWRNGMYTGRRNASGELRLGATDSFTLGEACALVTQVIPD